MKQFNLDTWLKDKSRKVVTRRGNTVRIICTDRKHGEDDLPIVFLEENNGCEFLLTCRKDGRCDNYTQYDLFFADEEENLSEDERTKKEIMDFVVDNTIYKDGRREKYLAWLEKQGEKKPSRFKVGDKVIWKKDSRAIVRTISEVSKSNTYWLDCPGSSSGWYSDDELEPYIEQSEQKSVWSEEEELTEFKKEVAESYEWAKTTEREDFIKEFSPKLLDLARKEILKDLPKLEKTKDVIDPTIPVMYTYAATMKSYVEYNGYKLCINDVFEKLPKEE